MREISPEVRQRLLKKWRGILTRYNKLRDNNWIRTSREKCNVIRRVDCTRTKDYYLEKIAQAEKIISELK